MSEDIKQAVDGLMTAFESFKAANDENLKKRDVVLDDKLARINAALDKFEPINAKLTATEAQAKADAEALKAHQEQLDRIEAKLGRPSKGVEGDAAATENRKIFADFLRYDVARVHQMHAADRIKNVLTLSDDTGGGYLAPGEYVPDIIKKATEFSPMRAIVRVVQTSQQSVQLPVRTGLLTASMVGEIATRAEATGQSYGMKTVPVHEMSAELYYTMAQMEDAAFNMEAEFISDVSEAFAVKEGQQIISGTGVETQLQGFLNASGTASTNSGNATLVTADGIIDLMHSIKTAYAVNGTFTLSRGTLGAIRKLKGGDGQYLWVPGLAAGRPNAIEGAPYVECTDMPAQGAGLKPVAFGDFRRAYVLIDRLAVAIVRDGLTKANVGQVKLVARRRLGGITVLPEAIGVLVCST